MRIIIYIIILMLIQPSLAYPIDQLPYILEEKYPNSLENGSIILRNDGNGIYIYHSIYPIPNTTEIESLWQTVQDKRNATVANQNEKALSIQDLQTKYQNQINNLNTVVNNSNYIQAKTNWTNADIVPYMKVLAWNDEVQAKGQIAILKILRWMLW